jgi:hypothetical protein
LFVLLVYGGQARAQWTAVGTEGFSADIANDHSLAFHPTSNEPYVAYTDYGNSGKATVMRFTSGAWTPVGAIAFSAGEAQFLSLAFHPTSGEPYVAYRDNGNSSKLTVMRFTSGAWTPVGAVGFSAGATADQSLAFHPISYEPYVAYTDGANSNKMTVVAFTSGAWVGVGTAGFTAGTANNPSLVFHPISNEPYIAYKDGANSDKATVVRFTSGTWTTVGTAGFSGAVSSSTTLAFHPTLGEPYIVYQNGSDGNKTVVMRYNGSAWANVGGTSVSSGTGIEPMLAFHPTTHQPYVVYRDGNNSFSITLARFNGTSWITLNTPNFVGSQISFAFHPTTHEPYLSYRNSSFKATVRRFIYPKNALNFDGSNDHVAVFTNAGGLNNLQSGTIEMWVKWTGTQDQDNASVNLFGAVLARQQDGVFSNHVIGLNAANPASANIIWRPYAAGTTAIVSSITAGNDVWNHIAIVYSSGSHTMYVNGIQAGTSTNTGTIANDAGIALTIGAWVGAGGSFSTSTIDEVRIWNTMRTCTEIRSTMNCELLGNETGLVAYYDFNQGTASGNNTGVTTLNDLAGTAENGSLLNFGLSGTTSNWVDGSGNGVTGNTPQTPAEVNVTVGASGSTIDVGGFATGIPVDFTYTIQNLGSASLSLSNSPRVEVTSGSGFAVQTQPSAATIAGGGSLTFVIRFTPAITGTTYTTAFRILNSDCDEGAYTFTITGKAVNATPSGARGNALSLNGTNTEVDCGTGFNLNGASFTLECWAQRASTGVEHHLFGAGTPANNQGLHCRLNTNGSIRFAFWANDYDTPIQTSSADGLWHHYAFTYNASTNVRSVYVDGKYIGGDTAPADFTGPAAFRIGGHVPTLFSRGAWNGNMDEVRIWNIVRTQAQIRENMHLTLSGAESGLLAYYQFNEASGNAPVDAINGNNGSLLGGAIQIPSTVSVGKGISNRQNVTASGNYDFTGTGCSLNFSGTLPAGEVVVNKLEGTVYGTQLGGNTHYSRYYWVIN